MSGIDTKVAAEMAGFYRRQLLEDVMAFWEVRTKDEEGGGYLTCFDRAGNVIDTDKYIWFQGRQVWMFSALYNQVEKRELWLELARWGREFLLGKAYAGDGRWNYRLGRDGEVKEGTISIYSDLFALEGLSEYAVACGDDADIELIEETYDAVERNVRDPDFKDIFPGAWSRRYRRHGVYMIPLRVASIAEQVLGAERTRGLIDYCLEQILYVFANDELEVLLESVGRDGSFVDDDEGRVVNPGHTLESMWFCMEEGLRRKDQSIVERAVTIADWAYDRGYDKEHGGIVAFLDAGGDEPAQIEWHKETNMMWHDKVWWVHLEALYATALAAVITGRVEWMERFRGLHEWCQEHFYDSEYGEWYPELYRDGRCKLSDKGTMWKAAYHTPRALMKVMQVFEHAGKG